MGLFLFKRLGTLLATLLGASVVIFLVLEILPGNAAQILMGPDAAPEAVQALLKSTQDSSSKVRVGAVYALGEIGPFANRASDDLQQLLKTTTDDELKAAINTTLPKIAN